MLTAHELVARQRRNQRYPRYYGTILGTDVVKGIYAMDDENEQIPDWLISARNDIHKAKRHWEAIRGEGQAEIKRGLEVTRIADRRLQELSYFEQTFSQEISPSI